MPFVISYLFLLEWLFSASCVHDLLPQLLLSMTVLQILLLSHHSTMLFVVMGIGETSGCLGRISPSLDAISATVPPRSVCVTTDNVEMSLFKPCHIDNMDVHTLYSIGLCHC